MPNVPDFCQTDSLTFIHHLCRTIIFVIPEFAEPPTSVTIMDFSGQELEETRAGPYSLDSILSLTCVSSGGNMEDFFFIWWNVSDTNWTEREINNIFFHQHS